MAEDKRVYVDMITNHAQLMDRTLQSVLKDDNAGLNAETYLASIAALVGRSWWQEIKNSSEIEKREFIQSEAQKLYEIITRDTSRDDEVSADVKRAIQFVGDSIIDGESLPLSSSDYHKPHRPPEALAAMLWGDLFYISQKSKDIDVSCVDVATMHLAMAAQAINGVMPDDVLLSMALEVAVGAAMSKPLKEDEIPIDLQWQLSQRALDASNEIYVALFQQNETYEPEAHVHFETVCANAGALLGIMAGEAAGLQCSKSDYVSSSDVDGFLEDGYVQILTSSFRRAGEPFEVPDYGDYAANAAQSIGHQHFPKLMVKDQHAPNGFPLAAASMLRPAVKCIGEQFSLSLWGIAAACLPTANVVVQTAEKTGLSADKAITLAMSNAVATGRVGPMEMEEKNCFTPQEESSEAVIQRLSCRFRNFSFGIRQRGGPGNA